MPSTGTALLYSLFFVIVLSINLMILTLLTKVSGDLTIRNKPG